MPLIPTQFAQFCAWFREWARPQFELDNEINRMVEILIGDICAAPPVSLEKLLDKHGISKERFDAMTADEKFDAVAKVLELQDTKRDNIVAALDMMFEARYGWPEGTVKNMTLRDVFLALEHAIEYDAPSKPSIWAITK